MSFESAIIGAWEKIEQDESIGVIGDTRNLFDMFDVCIKHPFIDVKVVEVPEGTVAMEKAMQMSKQEDGFIEDFGLGKLGMALRNFSEGFLSDPTARLPGAPTNPKMKKVEIKKLKIKYSLWMFPKKEKLDQVDIKVKEDAKKEIFYLIENSIPPRQLDQIEKGKLEGIETFLNNIFFSNFSHKDDQLRVIPLQTDSKTTENIKKLGKNQSTLLNKVNPELISFNIVYYKQDFTVVDNQFYKTDVFLRVKTRYPFFSFFSQIINLILSKHFDDPDEVKLRRIELHSKLSIPHSLSGLSNSELAETKKKWSRVDSTCLIQVFNEIQNTLINAFYRLSFERGVFFQGIYTLQFKPNLYFSSYYLLLESKAL